MSTKAPRSGKAVRPVKQALPAKVLPKAEASKAAAAQAVEARGAVARAAKAPAPAVSKQPVSKRPVKAPVSVAKPAGDQPAVAAVVPAVVTVPVTPAPVIAVAVQPVPDVKDVKPAARVGPDTSNGKVQTMMEKSMKSMTEMSEFAKGNVEAVMESAKAMSAAAETIASHFVEASKKTMEETQAAVKAMTAAKTPNELFQFQNDFAKTQFDKAIKSWSQASEVWLKAAGEVAQPLSTRMALAAETVKKTIAN